jgi:hypothetical protein
MSMFSSMAGKPADGEAHARTAIAALQEVPPVLPAALAALARALLAQGRLDDALAAARDAHVRLESAGHVEDGEALIRLVYGECLIATGDTDNARAVLAKAAQRLEERARPIDKPEWRAAFFALPDHARTIALAAG